MAAATVPKAKVVSSTTWWNKPEQSTTTHRTIIIIVVASLINIITIEASVEVFFGFGSDFNDPVLLQKPLLSYGNQQR